MAGHYTTVGIGHLETVSLRLYMDIMYSTFHFFPSEEILPLGQLYQL
jgi:hypothetical protein